MSNEEIGIANEITLFATWRDDAIRLGLGDAASKLDSQVQVRKELIIRIKKEGAK